MPAPTEWDATVARLRARWGCDLDLAAVATRFLPFFRGPRIRVDLGQHHTVTGRVSISTGWKPTLLLMERSNDSGSLYTLQPHHDLLAVQIGGRYIPVGDPRVVSRYAVYAATHGGLEV